MYVSMLSIPVSVPHSYAE